MGLTPLAAMKQARSRRCQVAGTVVAAAIIVAVLQPSRANAQVAPPTACDAAASFAFDPQRVAPGVGYDAINAPFAIPQCAQAVRLYPASGRLHFEFGRALEKAGRLPRAISAYGRAAQLGHGGGYNNLGELYRAGKGVARDLSMAQREFEQGAALGYPEAQYNLANMLLRQGRTDANVERARQLLTSALNAGYIDASASLQALTPAKNAAPTVTGGGQPSSDGVLTVGPSFDCSKIGTDALSTIICSSADLSAQNRLLGQTYYALRHQVGPLGRDALKAEANATNSAMKQHCSIPTTTPLPFPPQSYVACIQSETDHIRESWMSRLTHGSFADLEEAQRPVGQLVAAQQELMRQGLLPNTTNADGVFGDGTRRALLTWQTTNSLPPTGALDDRTATSLLNLPISPSKSLPATQQVQPSLTAAPETQVVAPSPANAALNKIFTPRMLDIQVPYLETMVGPAMRLTKLQHDLELRTYQVGDCELLAYAKGSTVSAYGLRLKAGCAADLSQFIQQPVSVTADATFGGLADALGGANGTYQSACIYECGNAADPRVEWTWEGSNAQSQIKVQLAVTLVAPDSLNAATAWQNAMFGRESQQYVASAHFNCDGKYQQEASSAFRSVRVTELFVGHGDSMDDQEVASVCQTASITQPAKAISAESTPNPSSTATAITITTSERASELTSEPGHVGPFRFGFWQTERNGATGPGQCDVTDIMERYSEAGEVPCPHGFESACDDDHPELIVGPTSFKRVSQNNWEEIVTEGGSFKTTYRRAEDQDKVFWVSTEWLGQQSESMRAASAAHPMSNFYSYFCRALVADPAASVSPPANVARGDTVAPPAATIASAAKSQEWEASDAVKKPLFECIYMDAEINPDLFKQISGWNDNGIGDIIRDCHTTAQVYVDECKASPLTDATIRQNTQTVTASDYCVNAKLKPFVKIVATILRDKPPMQVH